MDLNLFLEPIDPKNILVFSPAEKNRLGESMLQYTQKGYFPELEGVKIVLIGVCEARNAINNQGCQHAPESIRKALYALFNHWPQMKIADLGDIRAGHSVDDTYFAVNEVVGMLIRAKIIPVILGGSHDLTYALYQAYENIGQLVNIVSVDPIFDLENEEEEFNSRSYLGKIILHQPNYLFNYTNLGYQTYYVSPKSIGLMKNMLFDVYRLGTIKKHIEQVEPAVRNADILSFDISSISAAEAPGNGNAEPNGFSGNEACRIARYAGISDKLSSFGIFEFNPSLDHNNITSKLIAQMIWYFIDGVAHRTNDLPSSSSSNFTKYLVSIGGQENDLMFLKSNITNRWWIDLSLGREDMKKYSQHRYVPCSKEDYEAALMDEIPDRWWQYYQKLM